MLSVSLGLPLFEQIHIPHMRVHLGALFLNISDLIREAALFDVGYDALIVQAPPDSLASLRPRLTLPISQLRTNQLDSPLFTPDDIEGAETLVQMRRQSQSPYTPTKETPSVSATPMSVRFNEHVQVQPS